MTRCERGCGVPALLACLALTIFPGGSLAQAGGAHAWCPEPEARDFDFWLGAWDVVNHNRPPGGERWFETGTATNRVYAVVGGCVVVEHWRGHAFPQAGHIAGFSARTWDPEAGAWDLVLLWPVGGPPRFGNPTGTFADGVGDFFNRFTTPAGDSVISRLRFEDIGPDSFTWSNGISTDGGATWSSSWRMDQSRRPPSASALWNGTTSTTRRCPSPPHRAFDRLLGEWRGVRVSAAGDSADVRSETVRILDGCAVMQRTERMDGTAESFAVRAFEPTREGWTAYASASDRRGLRRREGGTDGEGLLLVDVEPAGDAWLRTRWTFEDGDVVVESRETAGDPGGPWRLLDRTRWTPVPDRAAGG